MIFKGVRDGKPYPDHGLSVRGWAKIPPRQLRLDELVTVTTVLALDKLLSEDSTFYGDLFSHVVRWQGELYLEDGLHPCGALGAAESAHHSCASARSRLLRSLRRRAAP